MSPAFSSAVGCQSFISLGTSAAHPSRVLKGRLVYFSENGAGASEVLAKKNHLKFSPTGNAYSCFHSLSTMEHIRENAE